MKCALALPQNSTSPPFDALPVGLAYIAGVLKRHHCDVKVFWRDGWEGLAAAMAPEVESFRFVGMQAFSTNFDACRTLAAWIKQRNPRCLVILGGVHAANFPEIAIAAEGVDLVVTGEGEAPMARILKALQAGTSLENIPGTVISTPEGLRRTSASPAVSDPDALPSPAWDLFYSAKPIARGHLLTRRGCPFNCANCPSRQAGDGRVRPHSVGRVLSEIEQLIDRFGARSIEFYDEILTLDRKRTLQLCRQIITRRIKRDWSCFTKIQLVDAELLEAMREAGCVRIFYGIGTAVPRLMEVLDTRVDPREVREKIAMTRKARIRASAAFSLGIPGETAGEALKTVCYALSLTADEILFQACIPFPGSRLHNEAKRSGRFLIRDWSEAESWQKPVFAPRGRSRFELNAFLKTAAAAARIKKKIRPGRRC
jgi:radical SAM superfamily enzyme YgiQ (UPF0313 family)